MASDVLDVLPRLNLAGSAAILLALRAPMRRLAGARLAYGLWLLVRSSMRGRGSCCRPTSRPASTVRNRPW